MQLKTIIFAILFSLIVFYPTEVQSRTTTLPDWFCTIEEGTFVGISEPNGTLQDAVFMALMQYFIATDMKAHYLENYISDYHVKSGARTSHDESTSALRITHHIKYSIIRSAITENKEYICQITKGEDYEGDIIIDGSHKSIYIDSLNTQDFEDELTLKFMYSGNNGKLYKEVSLSNADKTNIKSHQYRSQSMNDNQEYHHYLWTGKDAFEYDIPSKLCYSVEEFTFYMDEQYPIDLDGKTSLCEVLVIDYYNLFTNNLDKNYYIESILDISMEESEESRGKIDDLQCHHRPTPITGFTKINNTLMLNYPDKSANK